MRKIVYRQGIYIKTQIQCFAAEKKEVKLQSVTATVQKWNYKCTQTIAGTLRLGTYHCDDDDKIIPMFFISELNGNAVTSILLLNCTK